MARTTTNISDLIAKRLDERSGDGTRAQRLESDLLAFWALLDSGLVRARRTLTPAEGMLVLDIQNGAVADPLSAWVSDALARKVRDACDLDKAHETWGVDGQALGVKLLAIGDSGQLALVEWAAGVWARHERADFIAECAKTFRGA